MNSAAENSNNLLSFESMLEGLGNATLARSEGRVVEVTGLTVKSVGPHAAVGDLVWIEPLHGGAGRPQLLQQSRVAGATGQQQTLGLDGALW